MMRTKTLKFRIKLRKLQNIQRLGRHIQFNFVDNLNGTQINEHGKERERAEHAEEIKRLAKPSVRNAVEQIHGEVAAFSEGNRGAEQHNPHKEIDRQFLGCGKRQVCAVADDDVDEGNAGHHRKQK